MAGIDYKQESFAAGVTVDKQGWGWIYEGRREALIASHLVQPSWFPGEPGQLKTVGYAEKDGRKISVRAYSRHADLAQRVFHVWVNFNDADRERECLAEKRAEEALALAELPASHDSFRASIESFARQMLHLLRANAANGRTGYRYVPEALQAFDDAAGDLFAALRAGRTLYDASERSRAIAKIKGESARADAPLQRFLTDVLRSPESNPEAGGEIQARKA